MISFIQFALSRSAARTGRRRNWTAGNRTHIGVGRVLPGRTSAMVSFARLGEAEATRSIRLSRSVWRVREQAPALQALRDLEREPDAIRR